MKSIAFLLFVLLVSVEGCGNDDGAGGTTGGPPGDLASVSVSPSRASVAAGTMRSFTATGHDFDGRTVPVDPVWSVNPWSLGRIDQDGTLLANCIQDTGVVKATASGKWSGTSTVTIIPAGSSVPISIDLDPDTVVVTAGGEFEQIYITALGAGGTPVAVIPEWRVLPFDLGSVSDRGLVMSGAFPGQGQVVANVGDLSANVHLVVQASKAGR